jgi:hypothetical protein
MLAGKVALLSSNFLFKEPLVGNFSLYIEFKQEGRVLIILVEQVYMPGNSALATKVF